MTEFSSLPVLYLSPWLGTGNSSYIFLSRLPPLFSTGSTWGVAVQEGSAYNQSLQSHAVISWMVQLGFCWVSKPKNSPCTPTKCETRELQMPSPIWPSILLICFSQVVIWNSVPDKSINYSLLSCLGTIKSVPILSEHMDRFFSPGGSVPNLSSRGLNGGPIPTVVESIHFAFGCSLFFHHSQHNRFFQRGRSF